MGGSRGKEVSVGGSGGGGGRGCEGTCGVCKVPSSLTCGGCGDVHYCSKEHQSKHWPQHRATCLPYKVVSVPDAGKCLVATRSLGPGQVVLEDRPLALGPMAISEAICLGCHGPVSAELPRCPECWWPLCSPECASTDLHRHECPILAKDTRHIAPPQIIGESPRYDLIFLLRLLLLRESCPREWKIVLSMEHHAEKRAANNELENKLAVHFITKILGLDFTAQEVIQMRGAIATNAMQIRSPSNLTVRVLHPRIRLFNHSCLPNLHLAFTDEGVMQARTAMALKAGDTFFITYTGTTLPLWERRECLAGNFFFECNCTRCNDPTEMGTNFSNPRCPECPHYFMKPNTWLGSTVWVCSTCKTEKSEKMVRDEVQRGLSSLEMMDVVDSSSYKRLKGMLDQVEKDFHAQHYVWMRVAQMLLHKLQHEPTEKGLQLRVVIWQKLRVLFEKLEPGLTRRRGMTLLETGLSILEAAKQEYATGNLYLPVFAERLRPVVDYFQEAERIMNLEPLGAQMRVLADRARIRKLEAEDFLKELGYGYLIATQ